MLAITAPFPQFFDSDGSPLDNGSLYFGTANLNPETSPILVYWDAAGTQPAAQPVSVMNGYSVRNGTPANVYAATDYSLTVRDRKGRIVYYIPSAVTYSNDLALQAQIAAVSGQFTTLAGSTGTTMVGFIQAGSGAEFRPLQDRLRERISILDFIPIGEHAAIQNFTSVTNLTTYINAAFAASNGRELFAPAGLYNHGDLQNPKAIKLTLQGEYSSYSGTEGTVFNYIGTGIGLQIGVDDGNPDVTGPARGIRVRGIHFKTTTGATAIRLQNTALSEVEGCATRGFSGKIIDLRANVITRIQGCDLAGSQPASGNVAIWADDEYFGNYVLDILDNHIFQVNNAGRFSEGRSLTVHNNTIENIRPGASGGVWKFETSGYISAASFVDNYYENHRGYVYEGSGFTGAILDLVVKNEDAWGSADAGNVNPGVGNLPRTKVFAHDIRGNNFVDSSLNTQAALALPSVYPFTSIYDTATTKVTPSFGNKEYEDDIVYALQTAELMKSSGDFAGITGGTPGTLVVGGNTQNSNNGAAASGPFGWTQVISGAVWNAVVDNILGSWVCYTPGSGSTFNLATYTQTISVVATTRYFVVGFTTKGWSALKLGAGSIYDSGSSITNYHTEVVKFSVAPSTASFTLTLGTNATASYWAEMRLYEIGSAEFNEPGALNGALTKAVKRLMRRGSY